MVSNIAVAPSLALRQISCARSVVVLLDSRRLDSMPHLVTNLARRGGSSLILYDLAGGSLRTTPFPEGDAAEQFRAHLLTAGQLRYLGWSALADLLDDLFLTGFAPTAYLSDRPWAGDLPDLVRRERIERVIARGPLTGRLAHSIYCARVLGTSVLEELPDSRILIHPAIEVDEQTPRDRLTWLSSLMTPLPHFGFAATPYPARTPGPN